ncbi:MAG: hypothetical protein FJZ00_05665 [Candidatus Sericytochromatia bacterium]|uniref:Uncharacterized protein n=1 Tax=Candidatus Tanganyikabacteria bacterium TaxID=2961651 RepID=A0A937X244_9BACT|nr:hypothetical protein [Candidatus Tanganyikabacteria bacterium]
MKSKIGPGKAGSKGPGKAGSKGPGKAGSKGPGKAGSKGPGKAGSKGPGKAGSRGPGNAGSKGPGKAGSKGPGKAGSKGPKISGGFKLGSKGPFARDLSRSLSEMRQYLDRELSDLRVRIEQTVDVWNASMSNSIFSGSDPVGPPTKVEGGSKEELQQAIATALTNDPTRAQTIFKESGGATWSAADLTELKRVIDAMSPADKAALANTTFERTRARPPVNGETEYGEAEFTKDGATIYITDKAAGFDEAGKPVKASVVGDVAAHEIGHVVMGNGRWDSNAVREWGKLSHWVRQGPPETLVNGYDNFMNTVNLEANDGAKDPSNFVSDYAKTAAAEDYAESYRMYLGKPGELLAKAPDKFLYINAQSGKYGGEELKKMAAEQGVDLPFAMAELARTGLRGVTVDNIARANGLEIPAKGSGAGDAIDLIQDKSTDAGFAAQLKADPQAALGPEIWDKLSASEQALLKKPEYVQSLLSATAANKTAPKDTITDGDVNGWKKFLTDLLVDPIPKTKLGNDDLVFAELMQRLHDPKVINNLSPEFKQLLDSPKGQQFLRQMADDDNFLDFSRLAYRTEVGLLGDLQVRKRLQFDNLLDHIQRLSPADVDALQVMINKGLNKDQLSKISAAHEQLAQTGAYPAAGAIPAA